MRDQTDGRKMIDMRLARVVLREGHDHQWIVLTERAGTRGFPIVIGSHEATEIQRVLTREQSARPFTHQLAHSLIEALGATLVRVDIIDLRGNTYYAQIVLQQPLANITAVVDSRPSDAVALALRSGCPIRVAEDVLEQARTDDSGPT